MQHNLQTGSKWARARWYALYWAGYLILFTLVEGSTEHDFWNVFRNELISLPLKAGFVWLAAEVLPGKLLEGKRVAKYIAIYAVLMLVFAVAMRLVDNYIILRYFLVHWAKEPLFSAAPFLYNIIKLQFLAAVPLCFKFYRHSISERNEMQEIQAGPGVDEKSSLAVKCERRMVNLPFEDIYYCEAQGNYLEIVTGKGAFKTYLPISELEEKLPRLKFARIHRSFVVALHKVESHNHNHVAIGQKKIPIGRSYLPLVKERLSA